MSVASALTDPDLFAPWLGDPLTWQRWIALLKGAAAEPMTDAERAMFRELADREPPSKPVREMWVIAGRRSGKSATAAVLAVYHAAVRDHSYLRRGEVATIPVIAADRAQARTVFRYCRAILESSPLLSGLVTRETNEAIELSTGAIIEITTAAGRAVRGYTMPLIVADEIAAWRVDNATESSDEILGALRPAQATVPNPLLVAISTPRARRGPLYDTWREHHGKDSDILVVRCPTLALNPTVDRAEIDRDFARDPAWAAAEWNAEWRADLEPFLSREAIEGVTVEGRYELPFRADQNYRAFVDMSGGVRDSAALAIAHLEDGQAVLDLVREIQSPHSPEAATEQFANVLKSYRLHEAHADRYAASWAVDRYAEHGVSLVHSERARSDLYLEILPAINSGQVALLDLPKLRAQFVGLERRTSRAGRDSVDHAPGASDDIANAVAGALVLAAAQPTGERMPMPKIDNSGLTSTAEQRQERMNNKNYHGDDGGGYHGNPDSISADLLGYSAPREYPGESERRAPPDPDKLNFLAAYAKHGPVPTGARWDYQSQQYRYSDGRIARRGK